MSPIPETLHKPVNLGTPLSYFDSASQSLDFPVDYVRPDASAYTRKIANVSINWPSVSRIADRLGSNTMAVGLTAYAATLHLFAARQDDFVIGIPLAGRLSGQSSDFIPMRVNFLDVVSLDELHENVSKDLSFLAEIQGLSRDVVVSRAPKDKNLVRTTFTYEDVSANATISHSPSNLNNAEINSDKPVLACVVKVDSNGDLRGELEYDAEIFAHEMVLSLLVAFSRVIDEWSSKSASLLWDIDLVDAPSHVPTVLELGPTVTSVGSLLLSYASKFSQNLAVHDDTTGHSYTYDQLFSRARQVQSSVRPFHGQNGVVLLLLERNVDVLACQIGVNIAGLAWSPCDISQPLSRLRDIAADAKPVCIVAHRRALEKLGVSEDTFSAPIILADHMFRETTPTGTNTSMEKPGRLLAYMIYTSGSTGKPKGVAIGHASLVAHIQDVATWDQSGVPLNTILSTNVAWDASLSSVYPAYVTGGCIKIAKIGGEQDSEYLSSLMKSKPVANCFAGTPKALHMWLDQRADNFNTFFPKRMRHITLGGDEIATGLIQRLFDNLSASPDVQVRQVYGPTEGTILSSYGVLTHSDVRRLARRRRVPIDKAMPHAAMTVATPSGNELPRGFVGEIIIWGPCLLLEYNNLPELTAQRFLTKDGVRGWRSGDLGRHLPSGEYEILGRMDSMCKVKGGFRVELPEIRAQIQSYPSVDDCYVSLADITNPNGESGEKQIVAHVVFKEDAGRDMQVVENWKNAFDNYSEAKESPGEQIDLSFDHRGWTSNLGRRELTAEEMKEWLDTTVARLLEQDCFQQGRRPRVLEIGSGTGMILFRLAKFCESYTGIDLLPSAVAQVQSHARTLGLDHVKAYVSPAHLFSEMIEPKAQFDLIVCNSVSQYFPSLEYLRTVIDRAGERLTPEGVLFIGDIRNHALFAEFAAAQALASKPRSVQELGDAITTCLRTDEELLIDPAYFVLLARESARFNLATTILRRGIEVTDMTLFRYDAILRSQPGLVSATPINVLPRASSMGSNDLLRKLATLHRPTLVPGLSNKRIAEFHHLIAGSLSQSQSLREILLEATSEREKATVHDPEILLARIMRQSGAQAIPLCSISQPERFDLLVVDKNMPPHELAALCFTAQRCSLDNYELSRDMSNKQKKSVSRQTLSDLYEYLSRRVPTYMIPDYVIPLDSIPLTNSHKVDKAKLPAPGSADRFMIANGSSIKWSAEDDGRREIVEAILKVFASVLFTDKTLSPNDNFFLCGGHSLLATKATSLIRRELDVALPFTAIITYPTASQLAKQVEAIKLQLSPQLPSNIVSLQATPIVEPRAVLFVFHFVAGELDKMPQVLEQLNLEDLGIAAYGVVWEPGQGLNTLEKIAAAYAESVATVAGSTPCFLLGWCYGGMIATQVSQRLPMATTSVLLLNSPSLERICRLEPEESDYATTFINQICAMLYQQSFDLDDVLSVRMRMRQELDREKIMRLFIEAKIDRHDIPRLTSFAREHMTLPSWVTDSDFSRYLVPLADSYDILQDVYEHYFFSRFDLEAMEEQVILNLQCPIPATGLPLGLGWSRYELVNAGRAYFPYHPDVVSRLSNFLREYPF